MPYQWLPHIIFLVTGLGLIVLFARRLPSAARELDFDHRQVPRHQKILGSAPLSSLSRIWSMFGFQIKRASNFVLEAKDLKKSASVGFRIRKLLPATKARKLKPSNHPDPNIDIPKNESYYLRLIQEDAKNLSSYNLLGKFYLDEKRFKESKDTFSFLVKRDPGNAVYYARLAFSCFKLGELEEAVSNYEKSLALDSAQPNRYYNLGLTLAELGRTGEAEVAFKKALDIEPENEKYQKAVNSK